MENRDFECFFSMLLKGEERIQTSTSGSHKVLLYPSPALNRFGFVPLKSVNFILTLWIIILIKH